MPSRRKHPPADPDRYEEAIRDFRKRAPLTDPEFRRLSDAERRRAFWVAGVTQARMVQEVRDAITRALEEGTTLQDFKREMSAKLAEAWGGEDGPRMETVFRTNLLGAYNGGRHQIFSDPVVREARPYLRFDAVGDSRTSDICDELDGTVLPADDPFWQKHTPPLHHNCRSLLVPLSADEAEDEGITGARPAVEAEDGFGVPPDPEDPDEGAPSSTGIDPDIREALETKNLGDR